MGGKLSIIIPCLNEETSVEKMVFNINHTIELDEYEIIIVNSGGTETSTIRDLSMVRIYDTPRDGAPQARNFGAKKATNDVLIFADGHTNFTPGWGPKVLTSLAENHNCIITPCVTVMGDDNCRACGFKWKNIFMEISWLPDVRPDIHEIPFACSCCIAVNKRIFDEIGQFDSGIRLWGDEDSEISMRAWLMGHRVLCDPSIRVAHMFRSVHPYNLEWSDTMHNKIRFVISHLKSERVSRHLMALSSIPDFDKILLLALQNGVLERRLTLFNKRIYNDDWFFEKFPMNEWVACQAV
jgi:glycosyltransferase involved in cell wall biosynthesis